MDNILRADDEDGSRLFPRIKYARFNIQTNFLMIRIYRWEKAGAPEISNYFVLLLNKGRRTRKG